MKIIRKYTELYLWQSVESLRAAELRHYPFSSATTISLLAHRIFQQYQLFSQRLVLEGDVVGERRRERCIAVRVSFSLIDGD